MLLPWRRDAIERTLRLARHRLAGWRQTSRLEPPVGHRVSRTRTFLVSVLLAGISTLLLTVTAPDIGLTWDETTYMVAAESHVAWLGDLLRHPAQALSTEGVSRYWAFNHESPPLSKVWSGLVWLMARDRFDDLTAHRLGNILLVGLLVALLYAMLARAYGVLAGLGAVAALMTMPRFFFHAHLAALDVPVAVLIFAVIYVFWAGRERPGWRWTVLLGCVWGLALATKINALFIPPIVLSAWTALFRPSRLLSRLIRIS